MNNVVTKFMATALLVVVAVTANAQFRSQRIVASKNNVTKEIRVGAFKHMKIVGSGDIVYTQTSGSQQLTLSVPDNLVDYVEVKVEDGVLVFSMKKGYSYSFNNGAKLVLNISAPMVKSATITGSGDITFKNGINRADDVDLLINGSGDIDVRQAQCAMLTVKVNGSGDVTVGSARCEAVNVKVNGSGDVVVKNIVADKVQAGVSGSGDVSLSGKCTDATLSVAGSGDLSATSLKAKHVSASVSGSGDVTCNASETLEVRRSGSGDISYKGNPQVKGRTTKGVHRL